MQATFDKLGDKERKLLRPLFLKGYSNGKSISKMLVYGEAAINILLPTESMDWVKKI